MHAIVATAKLRSARRNPSAGSARRERGNPHGRRRRVRLDIKAVAHAFHVGIPGEIALIGLNLDLPCALQRKPLRTKRSDHSHNVENVCMPSKSSYASITSLIMSVVIEPKNTPTRQTRNNSEIAVSTRRRTAACPELDAMYLMHRNEEYANDLDNPDPRRVLHRTRDQRLSAGRVLITTHSVETARRPQSRRGTVGILLIPMLYVVFQTLREKTQRKTKVTPVPHIQPAE
jgi:hypothetical protein